MDIWRMKEKLGTKKTKKLFGNHSYLLNVGQFQQFSKDIHSGSL
jgi:hypothetical protein